MSEQKNEGMGLEMTPEVAQGSYSNLAIITHSHCEFVVDFARMLPGMPKAKIHNRIVMNPENAKRLLLALQDNINKFESQFGPIEFASKGPALHVPTPKDFS